MVEAAAAPEAFSLNRMTELAQACAADANAIPVDEFSGLLMQTVGLLKGMGSMMSIAFSGKSSLAFDTTVEMDAS